MKEEIENQNVMYIKQCNNVMLQSVGKTQKVKTQKL